MNGIESPDPANASESAPASEPRAPHRPVTEGSQASFGTYRRNPVSFVRRGTRLQGRRQEAWDEYADRFVVDVPRHVADTSVHPDYRFDAEAAFGRKAPLVVEIGSGLGEAVTHAAAEHPEWDFLAVEVYTPGLANTLVKIAQAGLTNVRVVQANAPEVLTTMLPAGSAHQVWVFFPDPWHKAKHHKRRLIQPAFAEQVAQALEPGGLWRIATDWSNYAVHARDVVNASPAFENLHDGERAGEDSPLTQVWASGVETVVGGAPVREGRAPVSTGHTGPNEGVDELGGWAPRFEGRTLTSFERKALEAGRMVFDLTYRRKP
ncbi:tRNA (guanosine(46)-N7)-methyltransferase TrmB [Arthrobacter woluwensis]|uniref:tRNA (guanosine(46)-N7)-methyltransferase TrmB n=1 Tax=Arthrobacter woluwensis TaxID=156980 RepID=UPI001AAF3BD8|nr:tRNA (guanosine(46)-N7)-methyltransferase TrmB [Arthrobacter woluwensis]QTF72686.1 tRNA (guanosine(46)-N7)-methyltransferase TrmB [Arthrobacter woluwensis]